MPWKFKRNIAYKQARSVLLIAIVLGSISTAIQIYLDLIQETKSSIESVQRVVSLHKDAASSAVYRLDGASAQIVTDALISHPAIYNAELRDDFGDIIASSFHEPETEINFLTRFAAEEFKIDTHVEEKLVIENSVKTGTLYVDIDKVYIARDFTSRAVANMTLGVLHAVVLALILLLFFYKYLSKPIVNIASWIGQLGKDKQSEKLPYSSNDELGALVKDFSELWRDRQEKNLQLNASVAELSRSEHFSRSLMDNAGDAMFLCDMESRIIRVNNEAEKVLGKSDEHLIEGMLSNYSQQFSGQTLTAFYNMLSSDEVSTYEDGFITDHGVIPVEVRANRINLDDTDYILLTARDITLRKEAEKQIHELAYFDPLTKLPNRRLFTDRLSSAIDLHRENGSYGVVLYLDLDRFKTINDSLGHGIGDEILCLVSKRLQNVLPAKATCARFGGDEFVLMLPESAETEEQCAEHAAHLSESILSVLAMPYEIEGQQLYSSTSIGLAIFPGESENSEDILREADTALYRAKSLGRNGYQFFDQEMQSSAQERLLIEKGLHQAVDNGEFELWFQPQYSSNLEMLGAESLIRWNHPDGKVVMPGSFIQVAEESGQIVEIGNWILEEAIEKLSGWINKGLPDSFSRLAVNISPMQFMQVDFVSKVFRTLEHWNVPGSMLELEITENMLLHNFEVAQNKMSLLKQRGITFAIDDFGTGYSSLKYLQHLPLDILKIDRSFVTDIRSGSEDAAIVEVIIATAEKLNLSVIAEGVETVEERDVLCKLGCHCYQGYFYSKPLKEEDFLAQLTHPITVE